MSEEPYAEASGSLIELPQRKPPDISGEILIDDTEKVLQAKSQQNTSSAEPSEPADMAIKTSPETANPGSTQDSATAPKNDNEGESEDVRLQRLGRERPAKFQSLRAELAFCYSILASEFMAEYFISGFNVIIPTLVKELNIPQPAIIWPASAFSLVTASFLLPFGRLADMYGGYVVYLAGLVWFFIWSLISGFSQNQLMLDFCRALAGLGPAAFLPAGVMLIGSNYRPGPRKNVVFSLYGGAAPLGFFAGVFFAGLTGDFLPFGAYFWIGAGLVATTIVAAIFAVPNDMATSMKRGVKMDWLGSFLVVSGLILVVFAITDASHAPHGWRTPYILVTLLLGAFFLGVAYYVEGWIAENPLLPFDLFKVPYMPALIVSLLFSDGVLGVFLLYSTLYMQNIMGATPLQVAAWFVPMCTGGVIISVVGGYVLHLLPGTVLMAIGGLAWVGNSLLFALAPEGANYWAFVFPAMICATLGIDIIFNVANIFISTSLSQARQGLAGALIMSLLFLGIAFCLAFADVTQTNTSQLGLKMSYQAVFWYQLGCSGLSLVIMLGFVRIRKAKGQLTVDERAAIVLAEQQFDI